MIKGGMSIDRSTVDYMGHYKGYPVAFDAKECKDERLNFKSNLKLHQIEFLNYWKSCVKNNIPVLSGFIVHFYKLEKDVVHFLDVDLVMNKIEKGEKSILMQDIPIKLKLDHTLLEEYFNGI